MKNILLKVLIISAALALGLFLLTGCANKENEEEFIEESVDDLQTIDYSSEIQLILDYDNEFEYVSITEDTAKQLVEFSHKNGIGTITNVDSTGTMDYYENEKTMYSWTWVFYGENEKFSADIGEQDGSIYSIKYNNKIYYLKEGLSLSEENLESSEPDGNIDVTKPGKIDWSDLNITIDGIEYYYPWDTNEFINNGWEPDTSYNEELMKEDLASDEFTSFKLEHNDYSCSLEIDAKNTNSETVKGYQATIIGLYVGQFGNKENPLFEFYGIKAGDSKETAENIFGTPEYVDTDELRGYDEYKYSTTLSNGRTVSLVLTFDISDDELYEIYISISED